MPLASPDTVELEAEAPTWIGVCAVDPMYGVIVWPVIALPLSSNGDDVDGAILTMEPVDGDRQSR